MTESSTETPAAPAEDKKVPVAALAKERAEKRAARAETEEVKKELASRESQALDPDFVAKLTEQLAEEAKTLAKQEVEAATKPLKDEVAKYRLAMAKGLNEAQADKVMAIGEKYPGLSDEQKLLLAKTEDPTLFASQPLGGPRQGGFPVGGTSDLRATPAPDDFRAKMRAAEQAGDKAGAQRFAEQAALAQFRSAFVRFKTGSH